METKAICYLDFVCLSMPKYSKQMCLPSKDGEIKLVWPLYLSIYSVLFSVCCCFAVTILRIAQFTIDFQLIDFLHLKLVLFIFEMQTYTEKKNHNFDSKFDNRKNQNDTDQPATMYRFWRERPNILSPIFCHGQSGFIHLFDWNFSPICFSDKWQAFRNRTQRTH